MTDNQAVKSLELNEVEVSEKSFIVRLAELATSTQCIKETRPFITGIGTTEKVAFLMRPDCKMWNCPHCAARNAKRWIARIINHINRKGSENGWQMFTLTAHRKARGEYKSVLNLRAGWKKLYNRMRYEFGITDYVKVWERHADNTFHLHGIVNNADVETRWLKTNAPQCGMGYQVEIHPIDNAGQVAGYIAKYFMKAQSVSENPYPKGLRRIEVSRGWTPLPDLVAENQFMWIINATRDGQERTAQHYYQVGYDIIDLVKGNKDDK